MFDFLKPKKFQYTLSPPINGRLFRGGQPVINETVYLHTGFMKKRYESETRTSLNGEFHFPASYHFQSFKESSLHQSYSYMGLYVYVKGKKQYLFETRFSNVEPFDHIVDNLTRFDADLENDEYNYYFKNSIVKGGVELLIVSRCELQGYLFKEVLD